MNRKILLAIGIIGAVGIAGWLYAEAKTHHYTLNAAAEVALLEETLLHIAARLGEGAVTDAEARQLHLGVTSHLDAVNDHPASIRVTGFTDEHHGIFRDMILKLEELLAIHRDDLVALSDSTNVTSDAPLNPPDSNGMTATSSLPDSIEMTIQTIEGHMAAADSDCPEGWYDWEEDILC